MTSKFSALQERADKLLMSTYRRQPIAIVKGKGARVWDSDGREFIDLVGGVAVNVLGHAHPAVQKVLTEQSAELIHTSNLYYTEPQIRAAEMLIDTAFSGRIFFCNSGTEANEAAIKLARKWGKLHRGGASTIICAQGSFHGRTMGSLAATDAPSYQKPFSPLPPGFIHVAYDSVEAIRDAITNETVAVMLEPIEGESGVFAMSDQTLREVRRLCDQENLLLILDEIQTGMGRTGKWWAHQHAGITPDIMTIAKGLGAGLPIGAVLANSRADVFEPGDHGCTFGGSPLIATVACTVLQTIAQNDIMKNVTERAQQLRQGLQMLADKGAPIAEIRGRGLILGIGFNQDIAQKFASAALANGVIVNAIGQRTVRLVPPLVITEADVDEAIRLFAKSWLY